MSSETTHHSRIAMTALAFVATILGALALVGFTPAPSQAAGATRYDYTKVASPESYLKYHVTHGAEILHIETDHVSPDGFWFATKSVFQKRGFEWAYQPYGMWCDSPASTVIFNPWMNTHWCGVDAEKITEIEGPAWATNTAACRASTGLPWKTGSQFASQTGCSDNLLDWATDATLQEPSIGYVCAPWEPQGATDSGAPACAQTHYSWENDEPNTMWVPAPDSCTGMPADTNSAVHSPNPALYVPASGDGSCTGDAHAPNCPASSLSEACTGVPEASLAWVTTTVEGSADDVSAEATVSKTAHASVLRAKVTRTAVKTYRGKRYSASASVPIRKSASESRSATESAQGSAVRSATMSCAALTEAQARTCAEDRARGEAQRLAYTAAVASAKTKAASLASSQATADASAAATQAAKAVEVTAADRAAAASKAERQALLRVNRKIARL